MRSFSLLAACACGLTQLIFGTPARSAVVTTPTAFSSFTLEYIDSDILHMNKWKVQQGFFHESVKLLRKLADEKLTEGPWSVTNQTFVPPSGDKRDWLSFAPYWKPDPKCPTAQTDPDKCVFVRTDGVPDPDIYNLTSESDTESMVSACKILSMAYYLFDEERYAERAALVLRIWFLNNETRMNPNVNYGQVVRGVNSTHQGRPEGILSVRSLIDVTHAVEWLGASKHWTKKDDNGIRAWFKEFYLWLITNKPIGLQAAHAKNNHENYYYAQVVTYELFLHLHSNIGATLHTFFHGEFANQITADGNQTLESQRTLPFHYQCFSLTALVYLAQVGDQIDPISKLPYYPQGWTANHTAIEKALWFTVNFRDVEPGANRTELAVPMRAVLDRFGYKDVQDIHILKELEERFDNEELKLWPLYTPQRLHRGSRATVGK